MNKNFLLFLLFLLCIILVVGLVLVLAVALPCAVLPLLLNMIWNKGKINFSIKKETNNEPTSNTKAKINPFLEKFFKLQGNSSLS
jgi:hypothetical protein